MKERTEYSRFIQNVYSWNQQEKGGALGLLHVCAEAGITSFDVTDFQGKHSVGAHFGSALSESGLSRDEIQLIVRVGEPELAVLEEQVDELLLDLGTDYLDILLLGQIPRPEPVSGVLEKMFTQGKLHEIGSMGLPARPLVEKGFQGSVFQTSFVLLSEEILKSFEKQERQGKKQTLFMDWPVEQIDLFSYGSALDDLQDKYQLNHKDLLLVWLIQHPIKMHLVLEGNTQEEIERFGRLNGVRLHPFDWQKINLIFTG